MKHLNLRLLTVVTLALVTITTACKKDNDSPGESARFSATLSGTAFQPTVVAAVYALDYITITGIQIKSGDTLALSLDIPDTAHVNNNISFDDGSLSYIKTKSDTEYASWFSKSHGTITLTTFDKTGKKVTGKFSGAIYTDDGKDSVVVTNGQFNTTYQ